MSTIAHQILSQALRTQNARRSARCRHVKVNGVRCGSPSLRGRDYCFFHDRVHHPRPVCAIPPLEDANSIQVAIMEVVRAFLDRRIDHRSTGLLLYALQTASANLKHVNFEPVAYPVVRDPQQTPAEIPLPQPGADNSEVSQ